MVDKIIRIAEICMWSILGVFVLGIGYLLLSYAVSFIDFKPNKIGPKFNLDRKFEESVFELDEDSKEYFELNVEDHDIKVKDDDADLGNPFKSYVEVLPIKETEKNMKVYIYEIHTEENVPSVVNSYVYDLRNEIVAVNKMVTIIDQTEEEHSFIETENIVNE